MFGYLSDTGISLGHHSQHPAVTCLHLFYIRDDLGVQLMVGGYEHDGHLGIYQGYRSVFHLCCRITFSMDITDLFQFKGTLHGDWIIESATHIEEVARVCIRLCDFGYTVVLLQYHFHFLGYDSQFIYDLFEFFLLNRVFCFGQSQGKQGENHHLTGERFCGSDTYLRSYVCVDTCIGGTCHTGTDGVDNTETQGAMGLRQLESRQRIRRLTTLRDGDHHIIRQYDRIPVTELGSVFYGDWDMAITFNILFTYQSCVPRRTACHNDKPLGTDQLVMMQVDGTQHDIMFRFDETSSHTVGYRFRLFENLFQHIMVITALLQFIQVDVNLFNVDIHIFVLQILDGYRLITAQQYYFFVVDIYHIMCISCYWQCIRRDEKFFVILTDTDHKRTALTGCHQFIGVFLIHHDDGVGAYHFTERVTGGLCQAQVIGLLHIFYQLYQNFGIRTTFKGKAFIGQIGLQRSIVFYNTIMYDSQPATLRQMRMRTHTQRFTMHIPTYMRHTHSPAHLLVFGRIFKYSDLTFLLIYIKVFVVIRNKRHSGTVITAILQSLQSLDQ